MAAAYMRFGHNDFVSFSDDISVGGWTVKKAPFAETIYPCKFTDTELNGYRTVTQDSIRIPSKNLKWWKLTEVCPSHDMYADSMTYNLARRLAKISQARTVMNFMPLTGKFHTKDMGGIRYSCIFHQ